MRLLIKFPTRSRPERFINTLDDYYSNMTSLESNSVLVSCDEDDETMTCESMVSKLSSYNNLSVDYQNNKGKIDAINKGVPNDGWDILLLASDDMIPIVSGYDTIIKKMMEKHFPDTDGVLWFNDGHQGMNLNTLCILGKKYYDRFGYIYHPEYKSFYCDNEFTEVSRRLGKCVYCPDIIIKHDHPSVGAASDDLYAVNHKFLEHDRQVWIRRLQLI